KIDGSYHCSLGPASPNPAFAVPLRLMVCWPPCCCSNPLSPAMVKGLPASHDAMPLICQSLTSLASGFELFLPNGNSYTKPTCSTCVRSAFASAQLRLNCDGWAHV